MTLRLALLLIAQISLALAAQVKFDVASVKPSKIVVPGSQRVTPDGIIYVNVTLSDCIAAAWHVRKNSIAGSDWLQTERYDIIAKSDRTADPEQLMLMLQNLLADRFRLSVHRETSDRPVYLLVLAKNGPKLQPAKNAMESAFVEGGVAFRNMSMPAFSGYLEGLDAIDRPVIDKTGVSGSFDFTLRLFDDRPGMTGFDKKFAMKSAEHVLTDLQDQLGLRLEPSKAPVDVLVVDRVQRVPTNQD